MKRSIILTIIFFASFQSFAEGKKTATTKLSSVTVYRRGAEINRSSKVKVSPGISRIIFEGLSQKVNQRSIQLSSSTNITILSVEYQLNYLSSKRKSKKYIAVEDSLELVKYNLAVIGNHKFVLKSEEDMLRANQKIGGINTGVSVTELQRAIEYFRTRMVKLKEDLLGLLKKEKTLNELTAKLQKQLNELNEKINQPTGEVVALISSKASATVDFKISYLISEAGWSPMYDLRAQSIKKPVQLTYKANVYQNSGVNWDHVNMTISTGNPTVNATKPVLRTWFIDFVTYPKDASLQQKGSRLMNMANTAGRYFDEEEIVDASVSNYTTVTESQLSTTFEIDLPYDIPSDGKAHMVAMKEYELPAVYKYFAVPKLDRDAFLLARVTKWEKLSLLPGQANIFFEEAFVGNSLIDPRTATNDTLDFSLGRDKKIIIKRELVQDLTHKKVIGANKKETMTYEISIRNTKKDDINIIILDQLPISKNKEIQVALIENSDATYNESKGELSWNIKVQPTERRKIKFAYFVKYPKGKTINH